MFVGFILFLKVFPRQVQMFHFVNAQNILPVECFATRITRKRLVSCMDPDVALERVFVSKWPQTVLALSVSHPCSRITWNIKIVCAIIIFVLALRIITIDAKTYRMTSDVSSKHYLLSTLLGCGIYVLIDLCTIKIHSQVYRANTSKHNIHCLD